MAVILLAAHTSLPAQTQQPPSEPYASIDRGAISYAGPERAREFNLPGPEIRIGLILPLTGPRKAEGEALLAAARMAIEDETAVPMAGGTHLTLSPRDENGLWGRGASEIVKLVFEDRAVALITSPDGNVAHLSEQVGNRLSVPVLTLASDPTTTQINIPWLFRVVPDDRMQARVLAEEIFRKRAFRRVTLVFENDHDGKVGRDAFLKAAQFEGRAAPAVVEVPTLSPRYHALAEEVRNQKPQAVVLWTGAESAAGLMAAFEGFDSRPAFFICHKAMQGSLLAWAQQNPEIQISGVAASGSLSPNARETFDRRFRDRVNSAPSPAVRTMYDAVRTVATAVRASGPNRARVRDALASLQKWKGVSGSISFDGAGNYQGDASLIPLRER